MFFSSLHMVLFWICNKTRKLRYSKGWIRTCPACKVQETAWHDRSLPFSDENRPGQSWKFPFEKSCSGAHYMTAQTYWSEGSPMMYSDWSIHVLNWSDSTINAQLDIDLSSLDVIAAFKRIPELGIYILAVSKMSCIRILSLFRGTQTISESFAEL